MTDLIDSFDKANAEYIEGWGYEREQKWMKNTGSYFNCVMGKEMTRGMIDSLNDSLNDSPIVSTGNDIVKRIRGLR